LNARENEGMAQLDYPRGFRGFPRGFAEFLFSLQFKNTVDNLPENKPVYKRFIAEPLALLYEALAPAAVAVSETVTINRSKCVSTMFNDMRFQSASPLKGYMYIRFREPYGDKDALGLYFDMGCEHYGYGIRIYNQTGAGMKRIRDFAAANGMAFTRELNNLDYLNMKVLGDQFARDRYPGVNDEHLKNLLNKKGFYIERARPVNEAVYDGGVSEEITEAYLNLKNLYLFFRKALYGI